MLDEAVEALAREDEVVEEGYAEGVGGLLEPGGDVPIFGARVEAPRGMVVGDDHSAGPIGDGVGEDFPGMHDGRRLLISTIKSSLCQ